MEKNNEIGWDKSSKVEGVNKSGGKGEKGMMEKGWAMFSTGLKYCVKGVCGFDARLEQRDAKTGNVGKWRVVNLGGV